MATEPFREQVAVTGLHDGDTLYGVCDLGFGHYWGKSIAVLPAGTVLAEPTVVVAPFRIRIPLINAPELATPAGPEALRYASELVPPGVYRCDTYKLDEYGRPMVDPITELGLLSAAMLGSGNAIPYKR
jgi:endonuclease YncB( thermonuclease family)